MATPTPREPKTRDGGGALAELRRLIVIAVPLWAAQVASVALPLTDALYMGRLDAVALAGGGLAATLLATAILVGGSALGGMSPRVARAHAASDRSELSTYVRHARWIALAIALLTAGLALCAEPWLIAAGQAPDVALAASSYMVPATLSVPLTLGCTIQRGVLAACGRAPYVTAAWALAVPLNWALDGVLAEGLGPIPALGLQGLGLATSVVSGGVLTFLIAVGARAGLDGPGFWIGKRSARVLQDLLALGGPIMLAVAAEAGVFALAGIAVGWFGSASLAAHRIATLVAHVCFLAPLALSQAAAVRVAKSPAGEAGRLASRVPLLAAGAWAAAAGLGILLLGPWVATFFIATEEPAFSLAITLLHVVAAFQIVDAMQSVAAGVLRGRGDTVSAMRWSLLAYVLVAPGVAVGLAFVAGWGAVGIWGGLAAGLAVAALGLVPTSLRSAR